MREAVYCINTFMQSIVFAFLFNETLGSKIKFPITVFLIYACFYSVHILEHFVAFNNNFVVFIRVSLVAVVVSFFYKGTKVRKIISYVLFWLVMLTAELIGYLIIWKLFSIDEDYSLKMDNEPIGVSAGRLLVCSLMLIIVIFIIFVMKFRKLKENNLLSRLFMLLAYTLAHAVYLSAYYYFNAEYITQWGNILQMVFQAMLFSMIFMQYYSIDRMSKLVRREESVNAAEAQKRDQQRYIELADSKLNDIKALKNDLREQLNEIKQLIDDKSQIEKADQLMDKMSERLRQIKSVSYCDDKILNAVLTIKLNAPEVQGINIQTLLYDCSKAGVDSYEMCSLISNMLDNAIESCLKADDPTRAFIEIKSGIKSGFFVIRVTNSFIGELDTLSSKGEGHGYGIKIIKEICRRYGGEYTIKQNGSEVISSAFLKVNQK